MKNNYKIIEITEFCQLFRYKDYTDWCIIFTEMAYEYYLDFGKRRLYILERENFKQLKPIESEGYPYDNYGISLMAVIMNDDNTPYTVTTRWNSFEEDEYGVEMEFLEDLLNRINS